MTLFPKNQIAYRGTGGAYDADGKWVEGTRTQIPFVGSIQPQRDKGWKSSPDERQQVGMVKVITDSLLIVGTDGGDTAGDLVQFNGRWYELLGMDTHDNDILPHLSYTAHYKGNVA